MYAPIHRCILMVYLWICLKWSKVTGSRVAVLGFLWFRVFLTDSYWHWGQTDLGLTVTNNKVQLSGSQHCWIQGLFCIISKHFKSFWGPLRGVLMPHWWRSLCQAKNIFLKNWIQKVDLTSSNVPGEWREWLLWWSASEYKIEVKGSKRAGEKQYIFFKHTWKKTH